MGCAPKWENWPDPPPPRRGPKPPADEWSPSKPQATWIPCTDQLPDSDQTVITFDPNSNEPVWPGYHDGEQWWCITGLALPALRVTHWMPLPEPPANTETGGSK